MKVLLTGGTGFVGSRLAARLNEAGHQVSIVSRGPEGDVDWSEESLNRGVAESDAIIHLAGESVFGKRWSAKQKEILRASRIETTGRLAKLAVEHGVKTFLSSSAIGYYGPCETEGLTEDAPFGDDFLARLCVDWEAALAPAIDAGVRTTIVRIGVVLGTEDGALAKMLLPFRLGLGGPLGDGMQWFSWIHVDDLCALYLFLLENENASGVFNGTAPTPLRFKAFAKVLGKVLGRPAFLPAPGFALRLALGEVADVLLSGQHVLPKRALDAGFEFEHKGLEPALRELLA